MCPTGKTSIRNGATSLIDCAYDLCPRGRYRVPNQAVCERCHYGYYQPLTNASSLTPCTKCPSGNTTLIKAAYSLDLCVPLCEPGSSWNVGLERCEKCPFGQYKDGSGDPPFCIKCPAGETTTDVGMSSCVPTTLEEPPQAPTTLRLTVSLRVGACSSGEHAKNAIITIVYKLLSRDARAYPGICPANQTTCDNININFISFCGSNDVRRKRQTESTATIEIVVNNVSPQVTNSEDPRLQRDTIDVLRSMFYEVEEVEEDMSAYGLSIEQVFPTPTCADGEKIVGGTCELCEIGTYSTTPVSYECSSCSAGQTTLQEGSTSSSQCYDKSNRGSGVDNDYIIIIAVVGGAVFLMIGAVVFFIRRRFIRSPKNGSSSASSVDHKHQPILFYSKNSFMTSPYEEIDVNAQNPYSLPQDPYFGGIRDKSLPAVTYKLGQKPKSKA